MHPRNRHQDRYDLKELARSTPELAAFIIINKYGDETIDFSNSEAVIALNKAILKDSYKINYWDLPRDFLCPPIPGRADYIHTASDLFQNKRGLKVLDIGVGANCIYPLIGLQEYGWQFVGSDINPHAIKNAQNIIDKNKLSKDIELRLQSDKKKIFHNVIRPNEKFDLVLCNPPFHESAKEAQAGTMRKWKNLEKTPNQKLNFGGNAAELWCPGGEKAFILAMISEGQLFASQVNWFSSLVAQSKHLAALQKALEKTGARIKTMPMDQGNKKSRLLAWTFN